MKNSTLRWLTILAVIVISGLIALQAYWVTNTLKIKRSEFNQSVMIALRQTAESIAKFNKTKLPDRNLVQREASNYYVVNVNSDVDASILEFFLIKEMEKVGIEEPFEYGIYDCSTDELIYGNCCNYDDEIIEPNKRKARRKSSEFTYYFILRFPGINSFFIREMWLSILFSIITVLVGFFLAYAVYIILLQKRYSEVQRDFINNMTHEFKTPISSIKIASETLANHPLIKSDERLNKYAEIISTQNKRLNNQVEKVLNLAALPNKVDVMNRKEVDLHHILDQILPDVQMRIQKEEGELEINLYSRFPVISADEVHLSNIVNTLLDNAIKYKKDIPIISILTTDDGQSTRLIIEDRGMGISANHIGKLFDRFYRVPTGNIHNVKGFGLGLYYVNKICKAHGWKIDVKSELGHGTKFIISFGNQLNSKSEV